jgi:hypothetical protein
MWLEMAHLFPPGALIFWTGLSLASLAMWIGKYASQLGDSFQIAYYADGRWKVPDTGNGSVDELKGIALNIARYQKAAAKMKAIMPTFREVDEHTLTAKGWAEWQTVAALRELEDADYAMPNYQTAHKRYLDTKQALQTARAEHTGEFTDLATMTERLVASRRRPVAVPVGPSLAVPMQDLQIYARSLAELEMGNKE